jgi:hypothetical protein
MASTVQGQVSQRVVEFSSPVPYLLTYIDLYPCHCHDIDFRGKKMYCAVLVPFGSYFADGYGAIPIFGQKFII